MRDVRDDGGLKEAEKWSSVEWEEGRLNGRGTKMRLKEMSNGGWKSKRKKRDPVVG